MRKPTWIFRKPTEDDIRYVADHMRAADRKEMIRWTGLDPEWGVRHSVALSDLCYAAELSDGTVCCIFGAVRTNLVERTAQLWSLSTDTVDRRPIEFAIASKEGVDRICREMADVEEFGNWVDTEYKSAMKWIEWFGGAFTIKGARAGVCGGIFREFYLQNPHFKED